MATANQLHAQAAAAYQTGCGLARAGKRDLAAEAFARSYALVRASTEARENERRQAA
jgi:hypothetical protein